MEHNRYRTNRLDYDAIIIGSGPNGLAAAIELARSGKSVLVLEGASVIGGSTRSAELTLPGFTHDICSTVASLATSSPFLQSVPLSKFGCELIQPPAPFAHPFDDGTAAAVYRSVEKTAEKLGVDREAWESLFRPFVQAWPALAPTLLSPPRWPRAPLTTLRFGLKALRSASGLANAQFKTRDAKALFAGAAAHAILPLNWTASGAFGLVLTCNAHADGWPIVRGGMQKLANAMAGYFRSLGGTIETNRPIASLDELPPANIVMCDIGPPQLVRLAGNRMPAHYRKRLEQFRYGPGAFKIDWALSEPVPWRAAACREAGTIHLGGTLEELEESEAAAWAGKYCERPYVLFVQPSLFDSTRAPAGKHTAWAYCHVPHGSVADRTEAIERQVERFAPRFRQTILARHTMNTTALEGYNPNLVGGDVTGGAQILSQIFTRPVASLVPYGTAMKGVYLCSASTPPGGGVHGMCGYHAARAALKRFA
ncbi:MAG: NAD(P)/FAD-dependent oxidoreductase [Phycisphaerae bacterium]|nr:NAD(P)/FAD-dependent oxidoreductase [Phycisphaerae bacterium]